MSWGMSTCLEDLVCFLYIYPSLWWPLGPCCSGHTLLSSHFFHILLEVMEYCGRTCVFGIVLDCDWFSTRDKVGRVNGSAPRIWQGGPCQMILGWTGGICYDVRGAGRRSVSCHCWGIGFILWRLTLFGSFFSTGRFLLILLALFLPMSCIV